MIEDELLKLGKSIAKLRIARQLKQSELAYETGISERTLQRIEAGQVVKSDGLLKVISYLGRLDETLAALASPDLSPYQLASRKTPVPQRVRSRQHAPSTARPTPHKKQPGHSGEKTAPTTNEPGDIVWPEDRK